MKKGSHNSDHRQAKMAPRRSNSRSRTSRVNPEWLKEFFSEMLTVERGGMKLYERALEELHHENLRATLEQFQRQTERHVELCEQLLDAAGGSEDSPSPGAEAAEHKAEGLLTAEVPEEMDDINNIENLVLAETKDHWNWEMLDSVLKGIEDGELKRLATGAVREVRKQEADHLSWNEKTLTQLALETAHRASAMAETGMDEENEKMDEEQSGEGSE